MKWSSIKPYLFSVLIALGVGGLAGFLIRNSMAGYELLQKPPLTPPMMVFPIVWAILYVLMGIGAAMVVTAPPHPRKKAALTLYALQLVVNFFWSILFFNLQLYSLSFFWLLLLWILISLMIYFFQRVRSPAGWLQVPYLLWVAFAGYLNLGIWFFNR